MTKKQNHGETAQMDRPNGTANGKVNGKANGRANGHAAESDSSRELHTAAAGVEVPHDVAKRGKASHGRGRLSSERPAVSDDDRRTTSAGAVTTGAACAGSDSYAGMAGSRDLGILPLLPGNVYVDQNPHGFAPGAELPDDAPSFVDEIARRVDLYEVYKGLLESEDEKIRQRALERLLEMKFGKGGPVDEPLRINFDGLPRPIRDENAS